MARVSALLLCCFVALGCMAQNRIDELVDNFSTIGSAKFTSVVDRDPKTRRVEKVVKVLELHHGTQSAKFIEAFRQESHTGAYSQQQDGEEQTYTLTCESKAEVRIYMLKIRGRPVPRSAKITIIVRRK